MKLEKLRDILGHITDIGFKVLPAFGKLLMWLTVASALYFFFGLLGLAHAQAVSDLAQYIDHFATGPFSEGGAPTTLLGRLFLYFNGAVFIAASAYIVRRLIKGTATDGTLTGKILPAFGKLLMWLTVAAALYFLFGLLGLAHAQAVSDLAQYTDSTPAGDWSIKLWRSILGDFSTSPFSEAGAPTTLLGRLFLIFNGAIFSASAAYIGWGVIKGVVGTAADGAPLGKAMSSAWYPIRTILGVSGGLPIIGGYTLLQALLMSTALLGIGIANYMWRAAVSDPTMVQLVGTSAISGAPAVRPTQVIEAAISMMRSNVCLISHAQKAAIFKAEMEKGGYTTEVPPDYLMTRTLDAQPGSLRIRYGWSGDPDACGSVTVTMDQYRDEESSSFRVASVDYRHIRNTIGTKASQQLLQADEMIKPLAQKFVDATNALRYGQTLELSIDMKSLGQIADTYVKGIKELVTLNLENSGSSIKEAAQKQMLQHGWLGAGSYYSTFAEANAALADAISGLTFSSTPPRGEVNPIGLGLTLNQEVDRDFVGAVKAARDRLVAAGTSADQETLKAAMRDACEAGGYVQASGNCSLGQSIARSLVGSTFSGSGGGQSWRDGFGLVNPVVALKNAGDYILGIAATFISLSTIAPVLEVGGAILGAVGLATASTGAGAAPGAAAMALGTLASYIVPFGWTLLIVGAVMAIYIPAIPWIVWMSAVFSYAASFLEGLIAAPLHSMSHMHTDGDGLGQATSKGYVFILNALARPALMVLGFFIASALLVGIGTFAAHTFAAMISGVQGNSVTGLASIIGLLVVFIVMQITLIQSAFEFFIFLPDKVIGYLGSGDAGQTLGHQAEQRINAIFMSATRQGMGGTQAAVGGGAKAAQKFAAGAKGGKK